METYDTINTQEEDSATLEFSEKDVHDYGLPDNSQELLPRIFEYSDHKVRVVNKDDEPWFVAKDVCDILGLTDSRKSVALLDDDERNTIPVMDARGRLQNTNIINEPGLYSLILRSRKPEAKAFKRWITHEVLLAIRKTGGYIAKPELVVQTYFGDVSEEQQKIALLLFQKIERQQKLIIKQHKAIQKLKPKAEYFDSVIANTGSLNIRDTAKRLNLKQNEFVSWLLTNNYVYRDKRGQLRPYQKYIPRIFELKEWYKNGTRGIQTLVTPVGRAIIRSKIYDDSYAEEISV